MEQAASAVAGASDATEVTGAAAAGGDTPAASPASGATATQDDKSAAASASANADGDAATKDDKTADAKAAADKAAADAQKATDEAIAKAKADATAEAEAASKDKLKGVQDGWIVATKADKEFGGENFEKNKAIAQRSLEIMPPGFKTFLDASKLGDHPEMFRWMFRVGKMLGEAAPLPAARNGVASQEDRAKKLYPNHA